MCMSRMRWERDKSFGVSRVVQIGDGWLYPIHRHKTGLLRACELLEPECLVHMLKAIKHLSMNATVLEVLQNANVIEILVRILEEHSSGPHSAEMSNHIFQTCFNLCRLNKIRQEEAAQAGIIPCLKRVIETGSPLKQFALPILCDLAAAGKSCRNLLWQNDGLKMYLRLLDDPYFQVSALEAILSWWVFSVCLILFDF